MVAKKQTDRLDKSVKRTAKTAAIDGRKRPSCMVKEDFSMIVLLSIVKWGQQNFANLR